MGAELLHANRLIHRWKNRHDEGNSRFFANVRTLIKCRKVFAYTLVSVYSMLLFLFSLT